MKSGTGGKEPRPSLQKNNTFTDSVDIMLHNGGGMCNGYPEKLLFRSIFVSLPKIFARNINYMPVAKFFAPLDLKRKF
jgi:hypothetical protein